MSFFKLFFKRRESHPLLLTPNDPPHYGAGCVFTNGNHILCGYQPHKTIPGISGIGGMREIGETYLETAFRETVEELFHVKTLPVGLLETLIQSLRPRKMRMSSGYIQVVFDFQDLHRLLTICVKKNLQSPLYKRFPTTLSELIQTRTIQKEAEVSHLCLLPIVNHSGNTFVNPCFLQDLRELAS